MARLVAYFRICLCMVDRTKLPASVGLAQARPNNLWHKTTLLDAGMPQARPIMLLASV